MPLSSFEARIGAPMKDPLAIENKDPVPGPKKPPPPPPNTPTGDSNKAPLEAFDEAEAILSKKLQEASEMELSYRSVKAPPEIPPELEEILADPNLEETETVRVVVTRPLAGWLLVPTPPPTPYQPYGYDGETMVSYGVFAIRWGFVDLWFIGESAGEDVEVEYTFGSARREV
ncbi:uncharacterized protein LAJ45_01086 [Morchella importuna]|uniref:uncharacterized protein n=1 Tax=Morchella importuna TaxID=1174673 RepID=UPI001E8E6FBE|nr:uncharacterized protein LAJ45_01086 [Morchella importuna]KAH8154558.1 hypothetical protein LAJ45_01086 [Morchella importuna]